MPNLPILPYERQVAVVREADPRAARVAARVAELVAGVRPGTAAVHVGSTAVPGLPGKGIVDVAVEAQPDAIPGLSADLAALGFCIQDGIAAFPPTRPLLLGSLVEEGTSFGIHLHVIPPARGELAELRGFRDALRADAGLRAAYLAAKHEIVAAAPGGPGNLLYTVRKGSFVEDSLYALGLRRGPVDAAPPLGPGATVGILGGGQLGRMLGSAARAMGCGVVVLDPDPACPAAAVADEVVVGRYDDTEAALRLAGLSDVVTYELEHVAGDAVAAVAARVPVRPGLTALRVTQDRLAERRFIRDIGEWTAPWREVLGAEAARAAAAELGYPVRLKLPVGGYDGRSQVRVTGPGGMAAAVDALGGGTAPLLLEAEIPFAAELSVVTARGRDGRTRAWPVGRNVHDAGILAETVAPAPIDPRIAADAREIGDAIARAVDLVGVMTVELFLLPDDRLMINELAPRVHNSGHWTIEGAVTSQFEQHIRAVLGLPLGATDAVGAAAMVNLLGTGPDRPARLAGTADALADERVHLHVYGKRRVFERRKMGHVTVVADDLADARARAWAARNALTWEE